MKTKPLRFSWRAAFDDVVSLPEQPYRSVREHLRTGDVVLFSGRTAASRLVRGCTGSLWSHIGMVVRLPDLPQTPLLWEATRASKTCDIVQGRAFDGVQLVSLDERLLSYPGVAAVRRLQGVTLSAQARGCLEQLMEAWSAKPYRNFVRQHVAGWWSSEPEPAFAQGGFCSELVAEVYRHWRLLPAETPAHHYVPRDFAGDELVLPGGSGALAPARLLTV